MKETSCVLNGVKNINGKYSNLHYITMRLQQKCYANSTQIYSVRFVNCVLIIYVTQLKDFSPASFFNIRNKFLMTDKLWFLISVM